MEMCVYLSNQLSLLALNKVVDFLSNNLPNDGEAVWLPFSVVPLMFGITVTGLQCE